MPIRALPPAVAARIAAGEVIERPASVVKELVENSLDAGASAIEIDVRHGGLATIRVTDDGCGVPADEVALAFQRHATSKLQSEDDLARIATLGFRGEALASIAAAATVRMTTRTPGAESAAAVELQGGEIVRRAETGAAPGTSIEVEALFSAIPARLKFIRSASAETARVRQTVESLALANPHVRMTLRTDGKTQLAASGNGALRDAASAVLGADAAAAMLDVASWAGPYPVWGLAAPPERSRASRTGVSLFVNRRPVVHRAVAAAVEDAYRGLLMEGRFPVAVIFLDVPPEEIDVNVHPNKREVRLARENDAFSSVRRAVRSVVFPAESVLDADGLLSPSSDDGAAAPPPSDPALPSEDAQAGGFRFSGRAAGPLPEPAPVPDAPAPNLDGASPLSRLRILGQVSNAYIVAEGPDGMYLIDQHAGHESVLYYRLLRQWASREPEVQPMLEPLPAALSPRQMDALSAGRETLERCGLLVEPFGGDAWLVRAVPVMARRADPAKLLAETLDALASGDGEAGAPYAAAASIACHSSVRAGQSLSLDEMAALADALAAEANPQRCPHGRPTVIRVSNDSLGKQFGRI